MFILPNHKNCLDENGKLSFQKLDQEFLKIKNALLNCPQPINIKSNSKINFQDCFDNGNFSFEKLNKLIKENKDS